MTITYLTTTMIITPEIRKEMESIKTVQYSVDVENIMFFTDAWIRHDRHTERLESVPLPLLNQQNYKTKLKLVKWLCEKTIGRIELAERAENTHSY